MARNIKISDTSGLDRFYDTVSSTLAREPFSGMDTRTSHYKVLSLDIHEFMDKPYPVKEAMSRENIKGL